MTTKQYQREDELKNRINDFLQSSFGLPPDDYYSKMDFKKFLDLKSAISDVNNTLTMRLTLGFLDWAFVQLEIDEVAMTRIRKDVDEISPNSNGYDIDCPKFVAEVKCNIPINGSDKYGPNQKRGILNDINALINGKLKASSKHEPKVALSDRYKFMVFIDLQEVKNANKNLKWPKNFKFLGGGDKLPPNQDMVYGVYVHLG